MLLSSLKSWGTDMVTSEIFKALSDGTRLEIVSMLAESEELCACHILRRFEITQPTLSHHMKSLCGCGLITSRKEGKWTYYSLNREMLAELRSFFASLERE